MYQHLSTPMILLCTSSHICNGVALQIMSGSALALLHMEPLLLLLHSFV
jgi:hypothetical protein